MKNRRMVYLSVPAAFLAAFLAACSAYTPGPSTTRSMAVPIEVTTNAADVSAAATTAATAAATTAVPTTTAAATTAAPTTAAGTESAAAAAEESWVMAVSGVNVRTAPDKNSEVVGTLSEGEKVKKLGEEGSWTKIEYNGSECYVFSEYLTDAES